LKIEDEQVVFFLQRELERVLWLGEVSTSHRSDATNASRTTRKSATSSSTIKMRFGSATTALI
jgi:hypothetical protein